MQSGRKLAIMAVMAAAPHSGIAQGICAGEVVFQCTTDDAMPDRITICAQDHHYSLMRHRPDTGDMIYDPPLIASAATTWFDWQERDDLHIELGFWSTDHGDAVTLHAILPWDDYEETVTDTGRADMWLQSAHWRQEVDQTVCLSETVYADTETLWSAMDDRGPVGLFFSQDVIVPEPNAIGVARVTSVPSGAAGLPVYASARPNAATPVWWQLYKGDQVDIIAAEDGFIAVAIPTNGLESCSIRPEQLFAPYTGPCATGWVDRAFLERLQ